MVTRLSGGLTPADGADPRTFPAIWNATAVDIEAVEADVVVLQSDVNVVEGSAIALGSAVTVLQGSAVALGSAVDVIEAWDLDDLNDVTIGTAVSDGQVLTYSTAVSGWVNEDATGGGKILQVVSTTKTDTFSTSSTSYAAVTGLSASITPSSSSNKILVIVSSVMGFDHAVADRAILSIFRDGTNLSVPTSPGSRTPVLGGVNSSIPDNGVTTPTLTFLDSPGTTSSVTYDLRIATVNASDTLYVNRSANDGDSGSRPRAVSVITVMEVAG